MKKSINPANKKNKSFILLSSLKEGIPSWLSTSDKNEVLKILEFCYDYLPFETIFIENEGLVSSSLEDLEDVFLEFWWSNSNCVSFSDRDAIVINCTLDYVGAKWSYSINIDGSTHYSEGKIDFENKKVKKAFNRIKRSLKKYEKEYIT